MKVRLLKTGHNSAYYNMGLDQALSEGVANGGDPVLKFYGWDPAAISIGYFQKMQEEVDTSKCKEYGIDIVRRITGGGAVFHDQELTYSFMIPIENELVRKPILESYEDICGGIIEGGKDLGIDIQFVPLNDLIVGGKKVSGNAQTRKGGVILQHGTILLSVDVDKMFELLLIPNEKIKDKMIATVKERVTSLSSQLGREFSFDEAVGVFERGFKRFFDKVEFVESEVTDQEDALARKYAEEKYSNEDWLFKM
jgi:lipoate-protein ligase A